MLWVEVDALRLFQVIRNHIIMIIISIVILTRFLCATVATVLLQLLLRRIWGGQRLHPFGFDFVGIFGLRVESVGRRALGHEGLFRLAWREIWGHRASACGLWLQGFASPVSQLLGFEEIKPGVEGLSFTRDQC